MSLLEAQKQLRIDIGGKRIELIPPKGQEWIVKVLSFKCCSLERDEGYTDLGPEHDTSVTQFEMENRYGSVLIQISRFTS